MSRREELRRAVREGRAAGKAAGERRAEELRRSLTAAAAYHDLTAAWLPEAEDVAASGPEFDLANVIPFGRA